MSVAAVLESAAAAAAAVLDPRRDCLAENEVLKCTLSRVDLERGRIVVLAALPLPLLCLPSGTWIRGILFVLSS